MRCTHSESTWIVNGGGMRMRAKMSFIVRILIIYENANTRNSFWLFIRNSPSALVDCVLCRLCHHRPPVVVIVRRNIASHRLNRISNPKQCHARQVNSIHASFRRSMKLRRRGENTWKRLNEIVMVSWWVIKRTASAHHCEFGKTVSIEFQSGTQFDAIKLATAYFLICFPSSSEPAQINLI